MLDVPENVGSYGRSQMHMSVCTYVRTYVRTYVYICRYMVCPHICVAIQIYDHKPKL